MQILLKYEKHFGLIVFVCAFLLYANTIWNKYNMDDELVTVNHRNTSRGLSAVSDIFKQYYYEDDMGYKYEYRPITHLSFAIEHEFLGESPHISHAINVLLYALGCFLLFVFLRKLLPQNLKLLAWIATLLFVFHPIHTEVVASIKNRDEILAMIFGMMSGILLLNAHKEKKYWLSIFAAGFFLLALLSKPTIFPFLMIFPIGLMFFDNLKFKELLYLVLPLGIAGYVSVHLIYDNDQSFLIYTAISAVLATYVFLNIEIIYSFLKEIFLKAIRAMVDLGKGSIKSMEEESLDFDVFLKFKFYTAPLHYFFGIVALAVFLVNLNLEIFSYYYSLIFYALLFLLSPSKKALFFTTIIVWVSLIFSFTIFKDIQGNWEGVLIGINMLALLRINTTKYILYTLFFTLSMFILSILFYEREDILSASLTNIVLIVLLIASIKDSLKVKKFLFVLIVFLISINLVNGSIFQLLLIIGSISSLFYKKWSFSKPLHLFSIIILLMFVGVNSISIYEEFKLVLKDSKSLVEKNVPQENTSISFERPLNFVESPVHAQSPIEEKVATGALVFGKYLKKVLLPYPMGFYYGYAYITPQKFDNKKNFILLSFAIILLGLFLFAFFKKYYVIAFGLLIYLSTISQVLGIFYPIPGVMGDRFLFLPSLGFSLVFACLIFKLINHKYKKVGYRILIIVLLAYSFITIQRNSQWKDRITLFEADIEYLNESAQAQALLGYAYMQKVTENPTISDIAYNELVLKAKKQFEKAIQIYPDFVNWWYDKSRIEAELGLIDESLNSLKKSISLDEGFLPDPYFNIANIYFYKGEYQDAIYYYNETIKWGYNDPVVYNSIAASYIELGNLNAAESILLEGFNIYPNNYDINFNLGLTYMDLNNLSLALRYLENAQRLNPNSKDLNSMIEDVKKEIPN